jgi:hypothetical protein
MCWAEASLDPETIKSAESAVARLFIEGLLEQYGVRLAASPLHLINE